MMEHLKRLQQAFNKGIKNKTDMADPALTEPLGVALAHFLQRPRDVELCQEALWPIPNPDRRVWLHSERLSASLTVLFRLARAVVAVRTYPLTRLPLQSGR